MIPTTASRHPNQGTGGPAGADEPRLSVIVPFHRNLQYLSRSLEAARTALDVCDPAGQLIVVADGAMEDCSDVVRAARGTLLVIAGPSGPARARNRGTAIARGRYVVFIDTDVVVAPDALARVVAKLDADAETAAVFGAYDEEPEDPGFLSQARNLAHSFVHQRGQTEASTFWAGLGSVRRTAFSAVEGFDERFTRPSVEDIDLGYRLRAAGFRIVLDHTIRGKHLKRWTLASSLLTDLRDRGIPWTQLIHRYGAMRDDLNVSRAYRLCVVVSYLAIAFLTASFWRPWLLWPMAACLAALVWLDLPYYRFFMRRRGFLFTVRWFPFHVVHHLSNGMSFGIGTLLFMLSRLGIHCPGALPRQGWRDRLVSTGMMTGSR